MATPPIPKDHLEKGHSAFPLMLHGSATKYPVTPASARYPVRSFDEFTKLRAILVGSALGANHPPIDVTFEHFFRPPPDVKQRREAVGPVPRGIVDEIEEDIAGFVSVLHGLDVEVHRPTPWDSTQVVQTPFWRSSQLYSLMPRDTLLVYGDLVIEVPSPLRARYFETFAFRATLEAFTNNGGHLVAAPRPMLVEDDVVAGELLSESEILFDGANCVRIGRDIFIDVNRSANQRAAVWLAETLHRFVGNDVRVHQMSLGTDHADVTLVPLRPGVLLVNPSTVRTDNLPKQFKSWERIAVEELMPLRDYGLPYPLASNDGIGRNILVVDTETVIVDEIQLPLIRALEQRRFTVIPLRYRHGRTLGGSWHCITLDLHREGAMATYLCTDPVRCYRQSPLTGKALFCASAHGRWQTRFHPTERSPRGPHGAVSDCC